MVSNHRIDVVIPPSHGTARFERSPPLVSPSLQMAGYMDSARLPLLLDVSAMGCHPRTQSSMQTPRPS